MTQYKLPPFPTRSAQAHKGTFGTAGLIGGSAEMSGAIRLAGRAALAAGAGLVRLFVPEPIASTVAAESPNYMTVPVHADRRGRIALAAFDTLRTRLEAVTAFGIGPGLDKSLGLETLAVRLFFQSPLPALFDADALNALAAREIFLAPEHRALFDLPAVSWPCVRILTPHPGEFARISGQPTPIDRKGRQSAAVDFVRRVRSIYPNSPLILVLKGAQTVVTDGERVFVNSTGNPGMATGGSGDVLTGILTAFLARKLDPFDAAALAVALHGKAGDLAAELIGPESLTADALIEHLCQAFAWYKTTTARSVSGGIT